MNLDNSSEVAATEENPEVENVEADTATATGEDTAAESDNLESEETENAAEAPQEGDSDGEESGDAEQKAPAQKQGKSGFQKRIDELTRKVHERDRFIGEMQERFIAEQSAAQQAPESKPAPNATDYDDYEEYIRDLTAHEVAERLKNETVQGKQAEVERFQQRAAQQFQDIRETALHAGKELYSDFEQVATAQDLPITQPMAEAMLSTANSPQVWYHLGKNPSVAAEIASMNPTQQVMAIGQLSAQVASAKTPQPSKAPAPSKKVKSRAVASNKASDKQDIKSWMEKRNKEIYG